MDFTAINAALSEIAAWETGNALVAFAAIGALTTAFIDLVKNLTPIRRWFQTWWIGAWLDERAQSFNDRRAKATASVDGLKTTDGVAAKGKLVELATGGQRTAFYNLPAEQLVAQMNAAAQITLDYPARDGYYDLLAVLSEGAELADFQSLSTVPSARAAAAAGTLGPGYTDARNRVSHRLQRNLDGLQIAMSDRWKFLLQFAAVLISTALIELAVYQLQGRLSGIALIVGLVAGYFAPVTRDLIAALQKLRK